MKKDERIKQIIVKTGIPEHIILAVIEHMLTSSVEAMRTNNIVELSGFGKFILSEKRMEYDAKKMILLIQEYLQNGTSKRKLSLDTMFSIANELTQRINETELVADIGRMEEQAYSKGFLERID